MFIFCRLESKNHVTCQVRSEFYNGVLAPPGFMISSIRVSSLLSLGHKTFGYSSLASECGDHIGVKVTPQIVGNLER